MLPWLGQGRADPVKRSKRKTELVPLSKLYPSAAGREAGDVAVDAADARSVTLEHFCVIWLAAYEGVVFSGNPGYPK